MRIDDLVLCTINTAEFYDKHMDMAREDVPLKRWISHVKIHAIPAYRRTCKEPYDGMSLCDIEIVAKRLQGYYQEQVEEETQEALRWIDNTRAMGGPNNRD